MNWQNRKPKQPTDEFTYVRPIRTPWRFMPEEPVKLSLGQRAALGAVGLILVMLSSAVLVAIGFVVWAVATP